MSSISPFGRRNEQKMMTFAKKKKLVEGLVRLCWEIEFKVELPSLRLFLLQVLTKSTSHIT